MPCAVMSSVEKALLGLRIFLPDPNETSQTIGQEPVLHADRIHRHGQRVQILRDQIQVESAKKSGVGRSE